MRGVEVKPSEARLEEEEEEGRWEIMREMCSFAGYFSARMGVVEGIVLVSSLQETRQRIIVLFVLAISCTYFFLRFEVNEHSRHRLMSAHKNEANS